MKKHLLLCSLLISGAAAITLTSCHSSSNKTSAIIAADTLAAKSAQSQTGTQDSITFMLPSPLQIGSIFKEAGLTYMPGLTDSIKETTQFNSKYSEALNMGIYGADLSYCVLNKKTQEALNYLKVLRSIADKIGFGSVFEANSLAQRFENNLNSEDSLTNLIADLQMNTDTYLSANKQQYITAVAFAGAWVESMYIGSKVSENNKSMKVNQRISEQMTILSNLIKTLQQCKTQDTHINGLISSLQNIETSYMGYAEIKNASQNSNQPSELSDAHIAQLSMEIQQLRQNFIVS